jgi:hypothetical protein
MPAHQKPKPALYHERTNAEQDDDADGGGGNSEGHVELGFVLSQRWIHTREKLAFVGVAPTS